MRHLSEIFCTSRLRVKFVRFRTHNTQRNFFDEFWTSERMRLWQNNVTLFYWRSIKITRLQLKNGFCASN